LTTAGRNSRVFHVVQQTGLTEPRVVHRTLEILADLGWIRAELARAVDGGRPTVRFHANPLVRRVP
jgi:hypothetical protein